MDLLGIDLNRLYFGNTPHNWIFALGLLAVVFIGAMLTRHLAYKYYQRLATTTKVELAELPMKVISRTTVTFIFIISIGIGLSVLDTSDKVERLTHRVLTVIIFWQIGVWISTAALEWLILKRKRSIETDKAAIGTLTILGVVIPAIIWIIIVLLALDNLGVNITTLVAGLGIGGVAIALAIQNVLGDLLASLSIAFDKPFVIGDFVIVDAFMGSVEYIGMKSTRLRSLSGEQIVMSNADLLSSRLRNYGRMQERRVQFTISVRYETPRDKLKVIPETISNIVKTQENIKFDRCHLATLGSTSIDFECVYIVLSADYNTYMDIQQRIIFSIHEAFENAEVKFAYPTQRVLLEGMDGEQPKPTDENQAQPALT